MKSFVIQVLLAAAVAAQSRPTEPDWGGSRVDPLRAGVIELGVSAGYAGGNVGGAQVNLKDVIKYDIEGHGGPAGELHVGLGVGLHYQFVAEAALLTGGRARRDLGAGFQVETKANAIAFSAGMHARFAATRSCIPYVVGGVGSVQSRTDTLVLFTPPSGAPGGIASGATRVRLKEGSLAPLAGVGAHFFPFRNRVGLRLEAKSYFPTGSSHTPFFQLSLGVLTWLR